MIVVKMKSLYLKVLMLMVLLISNNVMSVGDASLSEKNRNKTLALFEPEDGKTILIVGQEKTEIKKYWDEVGPAGGYMLYTNISTLEGLDKPHKGRGCSNSGVMSLPDWVENYPETVVQIGLYMVGHLAEISTGDLDVLIEEMAEILAETKRPVFLRIGYEFDGPWNRYDPKLYKSAYQRIVKIFRGEKLPGMLAAIKPVKNVAFVWHSAAYARHNNHPLESWYPGDDYVDWIALSWFHWRTEAENSIAATARDAVLQFSKDKSKPLMIAEAAPKEYFEADRENSWDGWFKPTFDWIEANDIKAYSYINQDWNRMPQWKDPVCNNGLDWGNTRVQIKNSKILKRWKDMISTDRYLIQGEKLMKQITHVF